MTTSGRAGRSITVDGSGSAVRGMRASLARSDHIARLGEAFVRRLGVVPDIVRQRLLVRRELLGELPTCGIERPASGLAPDGGAEAEVSSVTRHFTHIVG